MKFSAWLSMKALAMLRIKGKSLTLAFFSITVLTVFLVGLQVTIHQPGVAADEEPCDVDAYSGCADINPYYVVQGGDTISGNAFDSVDSGCQIVGHNGTINSWNTNNADGTGYYGAASQGSTNSDDVAFQVVSGLNSDLPIGSPEYTYPSAGIKPDSFGFANKGVPSYVIQPPNYGGLFNAPACMPDYYQTSLSATPSPVQIPSTYLTGVNNNTLDLSQLPSGNYSYTETSANGPLIIDDSAEITNNVKINLTVNGNVYIGTDIEYTPYNSLSAIPQFNLYTYGMTNGQVNSATAATYGNIYLAPTVKEIHGFFVAQGNDQMNPTYDYFDSFGGQTADSSFTYGLFSTCATISGNVITNTTDYATCSNPLTIYGSADATVFWLERSYGGLIGGTMHNSPTLPTQPPGTTNADNASEVFRYTPEVWIPDDNDLGCVNPSDCSVTYQSEAWLPPVL
jgi:hypothetical protein